jgi:hypothetical protein
MAKTDKEGCWLDARGNAIPVDYISRLDIEKEELVEGKIKKALKLSEQLREFKAECAEGIDSYLANLGKAAKVKEKWKGNISIKSFDESMVIDRAMNDRIEFNENLQLAKAQIDTWLKSRMAGLDTNLEKIVLQAFNVDKRGRINTAAILKLLQLEISDPEWKKAMTLLKESVTVSSTKMYIRFKIKTGNGTDEQWKSISLDFADCEGADA